MGRRNNREGNREGRSRGWEEDTATASLPWDPIDRLTSLDELVEENTQALSNVAETQRQIAQAIEAATGQEIELPSRNEVVLVADAVVEAQDTEKVEVEVPKDGTLSGVLLDYPEGANQSIGIGVDGVDSENLVPFGPSGVNYIALNDTNVEFTLDYDVQRKETLTVRFINNREEGGSDAYATSILTITEGI